MKKAFEYLNNHKIDYEFHDYKKSGISAEKLSDWASQVGWEKLINKQGATWRSLDESIKTSVTTEKKAIALMQEKTSVIKRPLIESAERVIALGFDESLYQSVFHVKK